MMFKIFRKKKTVNAFREKAAGVIAQKIEWLQNKWTVFMNVRVNRLSVRWKKIGLVVFVALSVLICIGILIETFISVPNGNLKIGRMRKVIVQHDSVTTTIPKQYNKVVAFRKYMDSLSGTAKGRKMFDSINNARPGLLDSAKALEKLYHNKNN